MKTLHAGEIRREGDEYRQLDASKSGYNCVGSLYPRNDFRRIVYVGTRIPKHKDMLGPWLPVILVGHAILQSDLMIFEYRGNR